MAIFAYFQYTQYAYVAMCLRNKLIVPLQKGIEKVLHFGCRWNFW